MKLLFVSDLHAAEPMPAVFESVLGWVGEVIRAERPSAVVFGGDLLQVDDRAVFGRLAGSLPRVGRRFWLPGNRDPRLADYAAAGEGEVVAGHRLVELGGARLLLLNTERPEAVRAGLAASGSGPLVALGHRLPWRMRESVDEALAASGGAGRRLVGGHQHEAMEVSHLGWRCVGTRGLDPARAKHGRPEVLVMEGGSVRRIGMPAARLFERARRGVTYGIAPAAPVQEVMRRATAEGIAAVQLTYRTLDESPTREQLELIGAWREALPGAFLSIHLRNPDPMSADPWSPLMPGLRMAEAAGADDLTAHLPRMDSEAFFEGDAGRRRRMVAFYVELALRGARAGSRLSLENIHNTVEHARGGVADLLSTRPEDMRRFIELVRSGLAEAGRSAAGAEAGVGPGRVGMILDVGHARNNGAVSNAYAPSDWIARLGDLIQTAHVHQVGVGANGVAHNHQPIVGKHEPILNHEGIAACLRTTAGPACHALVEVRDLDAAVSSWRVLQGMEDGSVAESGSEGCSFSGGGGG